MRWQAVSILMMNGTPMLLFCVLLAAALGPGARASAGDAHVQSLLVEPWGTDSIRVRASPEGRPIATDAPGALEPTAPPPSTSSGTKGPGWAVSGALNCTVGADGRLAFYRGEELLLREASPRVFGETVHDGVSNLSVVFELDQTEQIWGLGQTGSDFLQASGCQPTAPENGHVLIPLAHSSKGFSFFLNLPSYGTVCVDAGTFTWHSRGALNFDLWVTAAPVGQAALPAAMANYVSATGKPTPFPYWTTGPVHNPPPRSQHPSA